MRILHDFSQSNIITMFPKTNQNVILRFLRQDLSSVSLSLPRASHTHARASRIHQRWVTGLAMLFALVLSPRSADACACGCGVFDVGDDLMFPSGEGGMAYVQYTFMDQNLNWSGVSSSPTELNSDKLIRTNSFDVGLEYMFDRAWGLQVEVPYIDREFKTVGGASGNDLVSLHWSDLGDTRVKGIYTGFSPDMSTGITFGLKLPTGSYTHNDAYNDVDRDTEIGSGSTDILLGVFHHQKIAADSPWSWFAQAELDVPTFINDHYRPGVEADAAAGVYYEGWTIGSVHIKPVAQVLGSVRGSDSGAAANPDNSGYKRILLSPGFEIHADPVSVHLDAEIPVYADTTGQQLVARALFKVMVGCHF